MRKKIFFQNSYGPKGDKDYIVEGTRATFGIFTKIFKERVFQNSEKLNKQLEYVCKFIIIKSIILLNSLEMLETPINF